MLFQPIPQRIPHEDNSVDEVRLEGTFNMAIARETREALLTEAFRVLRPGGRVWVHGLVGDKPFPGKPSLPGPAAMVEFIAVETAPAMELRDAGFIGRNLDKLGDIHCLQVNGVELRHMQLAGTKSFPSGETGARFVLYRGSLDRVTDDEGPVFERGVRKQVDAATWTLFHEASYSDHFTCFRCAT